MIRFAWLQARTQTAIAVTALAAAAVLAVVTGPRLLHLYDVYVASCQTASACGSATTAFLASYRWMQVFAPPVLLALPALLGMFWGAPLVARELETGTFRLAWTQSVTRKRWLAVRLCIGVLASMAIGGLLSLILTWWFSPIDRVQLNPLDQSVFGVRGIVPVGYAAFAFALGVAAGALLRRTVPAMAVTLVGFTAARLAVTYFVRPYLMGSLRAVTPVVMGTGNGPAPVPGPACSSQATGCSPRRRSTGPGRSSERTAASAPTAVSASPCSTARSASWASDPARTPSRPPPWPAPPTAPRRNPPRPSTPPRRSASTSWGYGTSSRTSHATTTGRFRPTRR